MATRYKPREGQLKNTPQLTEFFLEYFKGVKSKPLRMSQDMTISTDTFLRRIREEPEIDDNEHRTLLLNMIKAFQDMVCNRDSQVKKRRYETGFSSPGFQIHLTYSIYPVPHLPWIGITVVTCDIGVPGSATQLVRFIAWDVIFNHGTDPRIIMFYANRIDRGSGLDLGLIEGLKDMIFEIVSPPNISEDSPFPLKSA